MSKLAALFDRLRLGDSIPADILESFSSTDQLAIKAFEVDYLEHLRLRASSLLLLRTATELSGGRDRQQLLRSIVRSARSVIDSDIGYISINNPAENQTRILMTDGVVTKAFKDIVMPLGAGVLGKVASQDGAAWTHDHSSDPDITHVPEVDRAVEGEGIHGILGAPLQVDGELIGALLVGDRTPRRYTHTEVSILMSLASLAAVALETSQLIDSLHSTVHELTESRRIREQHISEMETLSAADEMLLETLASGARPQAIHRVVTEIFQAPVGIWKGTEFLASAGPGNLGIDPITPEQRQRAEDLLEESRSTGTIAEGDNPDLVALSVDIDHQHVGGIVVARALSDIEARILHRVGSSLAAILVFQESLAAAQTRQLDDLMRRVVEGRGSAQDIQRLCTLVRVDPARDDEVALLVLVEESKRAGTNQPSLRRRDLVDCLPAYSVVFHHDDHFCAVVPASLTEQAASALVELAGAQAAGDTAVYVGEATCHLTDEQSVTEAHRDAHVYAYGAKTLRLRSRRGNAGTLGSLGLLAGSRPDVLASLIERAVGPLIDYDRQHKTALVETALVYLDSSRSVPATAKFLFLHENTVRQRLGRIETLLKDTWTDGAASLDIHLALRAYAMGTGTPSGNRGG